jgi:anti-anti-sigma factor
VTLPVTTGRIGGGVVQVRPVGEVDVDNAYRIREVVDRVLARAKPTAIVLDLSGVSIIDSVGIGVLVSCYHAASACGVPLTVVSPSATVYRQLWVSGLAGLFGLPTPRPTDERGPAAARRAPDVRRDG